MVVRRLDTESKYTIRDDAKECKMIAQSSKFVQVSKQGCEVTITLSLIVGSCLLAAHHHIIMFSAMINFLTYTEKAERQIRKISHEFVERLMVHSRDILQRG